MYYQSKQESEENEQIMKMIEIQYQKTPFYGSRRMTVILKQNGYQVNRKRVQRLMNKLGIETIYPKPKLSKTNKAHKKYPYLLRDVEIKKPDQVWSTDITYIRCNQGRLYLTAIIDWYSRYILSWRISNTMETEFCIDALEDAFDINRPKVFNTDQVSRSSMYYQSIIAVKYNLP